MIVVDHPLLANPTADRYAQIIADVAKARGAGSIVANSTTFAKDILPRASAILSAAMAGDVTGYSFENGELRLRRPMYAGAAMATVALAGRPLVITVRAVRVSCGRATRTTGRTHRLECGRLDAAKSQRIRRA